MGIDKVRSFDKKGIEEVGVDKVRSSNEVHSIAQVVRLVYHEKVREVLMRLHVKCMGNSYNVEADRLYATPTTNWSIVFSSSTYAFFSLARYTFTSVCIQYSEAEYL